MSRFCLGLLLALALFSAGCGGGYGSNNMGGGGSPMIASLAPNMANHGDPAFTLTVNGSGFGTDAVVYWNGSALPSAYGMSGKVTGQVSAADVLTAGTAQVYVRTGGKNSNMMNFPVN